MRLRTLGDPTRPCVITTSNAIMYRRWGVPDGMLLWDSLLLVCECQLGCLWMAFSGHRSTTSIAAAYPDSPHRLAIAQPVT